MTDTATGELSSNLVFYEQLRMPLQAMSWAIYPGMVLLLLIFWVMRAPCDRQDIAVWCTVAGLTWLGCAWHAQSRLKLALDMATAKRLLTELRFLYAFEGAVWGSLSWVTMGSCSVMESALAIAINAAVAASRMMLLSSVSSVFLIYILVGGVVWIVGSSNFSGLPSHILGALGLLYVLTLFFQARVHARSLTSSIQLRFENEALLEKLNQQIQIAESAREKAETANRAKSQFLAAVSHDLRQPAQAQGLFLEVLSRTALDERQRGLLENVSAATRASVDMLNTLLDFSRLEAGVIDPQMQGFKVQSILNKIEGEFGPQADAKNLVYRSIETDLVAYSDPLLVEMILRNLISNAIRYTERGGLLVACRRRGGLVSLEVWDTGVGIAPEHQQDVFREFLQLGNPERDRHKGLGLGLAIVDSLARRLGSQIRLSSRPGRGSGFRFSLPMGSLVSAGALVHEDVPVNTCGARVLVVDDDEAVRTGMGLLLSDWGYRCDLAESIDEAVEFARRQAPAVVITDYRLRGPRTGIDVIAALRALRGSDLPALLITGDTAPDRLNEAHASSIPLLHKPVRPEELKHKLEALVG
jgi:two-component system, sensor histidine kinase